MCIISEMVLKMSYFHKNLALSEENIAADVRRFPLCFIMGFNGKCTYYHPPLCKVVCLAIEVATTVELMLYIDIKTHLRQV